MKNTNMKKQTAANNEFLRNAKETSARGIYLRAVLLVNNGFQEYAKNFLAHGAEYNTGDDRWFTKTDTGENLYLLPEDASNELIDLLSPNEH
jgi:hypothetical protein